MSTITWLHISDLHFREQGEWDADIVLRGLLGDVQDCVREYDLQLDLILVSGDIAFTGKSAEYAQAERFLGRLLEATALPGERLFVVPGNHDVDRDLIDAGSRSAALSCTDAASVGRALDDEGDHLLLLRKFRGYTSFVDRLLHRPAFSDNAFFSVQTMDMAGQRLGMVALNSAWLSCDDGDRNRLALGEKQVRRALDACAGSDLSIAVLHHPFDWLQDEDRGMCEKLLMDRCDFVLRGHRHHAGLVELATPDAKAMYISAGACYTGRRYPNGYNIVTLDVSAQRGTVFLRTWSSNGPGFWTRDAQTYKSVKDGQYEFTLAGPAGDGIAPVATKDDGSSTATVLIDLASPFGDTLALVDHQFSLHSERTVREARQRISGLTEPIARDETKVAERQVCPGKPLILTGDAGVGKSGIAAELAECGPTDGAIVLFIDARHVGHVHSDAELRLHLDLRGPVSSAIAFAGKHTGCRLIVDQLDSTVGSVAAEVMADLALDCSAFDGVEVVVVLRAREAQERKLADRLVRGGFSKLKVLPLSGARTAELLAQIGIHQTSMELIELGCNLLNLNLIAAINQRRPDTDFEHLTGEVDLWHAYIQTVLEQESTLSGSSDAGTVVAEAVALARDAVKSDNQTVCLPYPMTHAQQRLVSWGILVQEGGRIYRYAHERFQDFLCAWDACERRVMSDAVIDELGAHRSGNVLWWMDRIYARQDVFTHKQFLRGLLAA